MHRMSRLRLVKPRVRRGIVPRPRIDRLLDQGRETAFTLVAAPAGYGKTVAVEGWVGDRPVAWVSLESADNDPVRLWSSAAAACEADEALERLRSPAGVVQPAIDALAGALEADTRPFALVLDDLQLLDDTRCLRSIGYAIGVLPANVQLVALTRTIPRLRLARLRAQGLLTEVGASELAFTAEEARLLLGESFGDAEVVALTARTEGWPAALYLAALWRREHGDAEIPAAAGPLGDFLAAEVLADVPSEMRHFLRRTAVMPRVSGELADAVVPDARGARRLRLLQHMNLLVVALARRPGWYRYHALMREFLVAELGDEEADALRRAALTWSRERGFVEDAAEYARAARDWEALARLVEEHQLNLLRTGRSVTLARWTAALPRTTLIEHPNALVAAMVAAHAVARPAAEIRRLLALADRARDTSWTAYAIGTLELVRSYYADDDAAGAVAAAVAAVESGEDELRVAGLSSLALTALLAGDDVRGAEAAMAALAHPDAANRPIAYIAASAALALAEAHARHANLAREAADDALAMARTADLLAAPPGALALLADAVVARLEERLTHAQRAAERASRAIIAGGVWQAWALLELAAIELRRGRRNAASRALAHAGELLARVRDPGALTALAEQVRAGMSAGAAQPPLGERPSAAELAVLRLLPHHTVREIAQELYLSVNTIRSHIRSLYRKLGVNTRTEAASRATALGYLDESDI